MVTLVLEGCWMNSRVRHLAKDSQFHQAIESQQTTRMSEYQRKDEDGQT